jgi:hypothetical protein
MAGMKNIFNVYSENLQERDHPNDIVVGDRITMNLDRTGCESVHGRIASTKSPPICKNLQRKSHESYDTPNGVT